MNEQILNVSRETFFQRLSGGLSHLGIELSLSGSNTLFDFWQEVLRWNRTHNLTTITDIEKAIEQFSQEQADSLLSVIKAHPWLWHIVDGKPESFNFNYRARPRRQDRETEYLENGSIYVFKPWVISSFNNRLGGKITLYEMDEKSLIDIDEPWDLELCEWMISRVSTL